MAVIELRSGDGASQTPRILVVEDDDDARAAIVETLADQGYDVDEAPNGAVALEKALMRKPDVVLFDYAMPVTDGPTLVDELRMLVRPLPALLAISGSSRAGEWCATHGVHLFLAKPFGESTLRRAALDAVSMACGRPPELVETEPAPRMSLHSACVIAVGPEGDAEVLRPSLPHSLQHARIALVDTPAEAIRLLSEVTPHLLLLTDDDDQAALREEARRRAIPVIVRGAAPPDSN